MKYFITLTLSALFTVFVFAEDKPALDDAEWEKLTEGVDYVEQERDAPSFRMPNLGLDVDSDVIKYIFFTIIVGLLIYVLIKYIMSIQAAGTGDSDDVAIEVENLEEAEANPMKADLQKLIEKLIGSGDYRGAVRAYFLLVLQRMHRSKLIEWEKPKTNFDYVFEVRKQSFHADFTRLTRTFERVWYGEHAVDENHFQENEKKFKQLLAKLPHE